MCNIEFNEKCSVNLLLLLTVRDIILKVFVFQNMDLNESSGDTIVNSDVNDSNDVLSSNSDSFSQKVVKRVNFTLDNDVDEGITDDLDVDVSVNCVNGGDFSNNSFKSLNIRDNRLDNNNDSVSDPNEIGERLLESTCGENDNDFPVNSDSPTGSGIEELLGSFDSHGRRRNHIFILSSAGKPVYTRYGNEDKLVALFGVMQALVSVVQDSDDSLQAIKCGKTSIAFLSEGPIILVGVTHSNDSLEYLKKKLNYIYSQVVSILTLTQLTKIFEERHNYDLRRLLTGSERIIDHLLSFVETRPEFFLDAISCLSMPQSARDAVSNSIISSCCKIKNVVFAILIGNDRVVSIVSLKKYKLESCDIHLICNLVSSSESFKTAESWTPICLPKFDPSGYLHAHVSYLSDCPACLLLLTVEKDSFFQLSEAKSKIEEKLMQNQSIIILKTALSKKSLPSVKSMDIPYVRHFLFKSCTNSQLFSPEIAEPYETEEKWQALLAKYERLYSFMTNPLQRLSVLYQQLPNEVMLGKITKKFELFVTFEPFIQKSDCNSAVDKILQWIQKEEERLFMINYLYFN